MIAYYKFGQAAAMVVFALFIVNKAGSLIYQRDFAEGLQKLSTNEYIILAGTFHSVHALTTRLYPLQHNAPRGSLLDRPDPPSGIEVLETENFRLQCFETLTGTKFLIFTEPTQQNVDSILKKIYELYADYVMKNPFYQVDNPVRCEVFDRKLVGYVRPLNHK
ncbi:hypothetical protein V496_05091 [Pseudogymnoascus sp. VKM F-4515 (FW-2607)]|nr:hypothetical protein V496_05091 [Pseudogymnoascus sp. VKM F-4515 (FW-2607)]KFY88090.1 hypothetical protein V498_06915 [Pseudogymnoascus sp. VKM F-4517 (FW-2822)]